MLRVVGEYVFGPNLDEPLFTARFLSDGSVSLWTGDAIEPNEDYRIPSSAIGELLSAAKSAQATKDRLVQAGVPMRI